MGEITSVSFVNRNASSMGLDVIVCGPFAEEDEVAFEDVSLLYKDWIDPTYDKRNFLHMQPDSVEAVEMENGWRGYEFAFDSFVIPPGLNPEQKKFTGVKAINAESVCSFTFRFCPRLEEKFRFDVHVFAYPRENRSGAAGWSPLFGKTKSDAIDEYNKTQRHFRDSVKRHGGDVSRYQELDKETYIWEDRT